MRLVVAEDHDSLSLEAADIMTAAVTARPDAAVVLATGETPMKLYHEMVWRHRRGKADLSRLRIFQLDEYLGLAPDDPRLLYRWMSRALLKPLAFPEDRVVRLPSDAPDPEAACRAYDQAVREAGGFDLAVLGLGPNGHLGFNDPPAGPRSPARVVDLSEETVESNARYWGGRARVPRRAMTAGMEALLSAKQILLLASGARKHEILRRTIEGPTTPRVPASYLQKNPNVTIIADEAAWLPDTPQVPDPAV